MKKLQIYLVFFLTFIVGIFGNLEFVEAGRGCCSWHGGQAYCDTSVGRRVCKDGTYSPTCTCDNSSSSSQFYKQETCTDKYGIGAYEKYNGKCACRNGYAAGKDYLGNIKCINLDTYCSNKYNYNSYYDSFNNRCACYGSDVIYQGECTSLDDICKEMYGYGYSYSSLKEACVKYY